MLHCRKMVEMLHRSMYIFGHQEQRAAGDDPLRRLK